MTIFILFSFNKNMDNISFSSRIRITSKNEYFKQVKPDFVNVGYPWTIQQTAFSRKAYTNKIYDCTAVGITDDTKVMLMHICPTIEWNLDFNAIKEFIIKKVSTTLNTDNLQGIILGSKNNIVSPYSTKLFDFLENVLENLNIQYSKFKGGDYENNLAYNTISDEWIIGSNFFEKQTNPNEDIFKAATKIFKEVKIANCDELSW